MYGPDKHPRPERHHSGPGNCGLSLGLRYPRSAVKQLVPDGLHIIERPSREASGNGEEEGGGGSHLPHLEQYETTPPKPLRTVDRLQNSHQAKNVMTKFVVSPTSFHLPIP